MNVTLLPPRTTKLERALEQSTARIDDAPHPIDTLWDPAHCPENFLPFLAWALSVDDWDPDWDIETRRRVVAIALKVHRTKGTPGAVRLALEVLGFGRVRLDEWFRQNPPGAPYTFRIDMDLASAPMAERRWRSALRAINDAKNLRSHLAGVAVHQQSAGRTHIAAALTSAAGSVIYPALISNAEMALPARLCAAGWGGIIGRVWPRQKSAAAAGMRTILSIILYPETSA